MPGRPTYTERLGRRYRISADGMTHLVEASVRGEDKEGRYTFRTPVCIADLNFFELCEAMGWEVPSDLAAAKRESIAKNLQQYQNRTTMNAQEPFGLDAQGFPVYAGETMYRKKNSEKFTVTDEGGLRSAAGKIVSAPYWENFVHTFDATDKGARLAAAREKKEEKAGTQLQENPLVEGECKTRTPEEASRSAAKQREQARKKKAESAIAKAACFEHQAEGSCPVWDALDKIPVEKVLAEIPDKELLEEIGRRGLSTPAAEWSGDDESDLATRFALYTYKDDPGVLYLSNVFVDEVSRNQGFGTRILRAAEEVAKTMGATTIGLKVQRDSPANAWYRKYGFGYVASENGYDWLKKNIEWRDEEVKAPTLDKATDGQLADELRRRGYEVKATKIVEL